MLFEKWDKCYCWEKEIKKQALGLNLSKDVQCKYGEEFTEVEKEKLRQKEAGYWLWVKEVQTLPFSDSK